MEIGRSVPRRRKAGAVFMLIGLLSGLLAVIAPTVSAEPLPSGTLGNFENEGDQDDATLNTGTIDWETVKTDPRITEWLLIHDDGDTDTNDSSWIDSAKEQDPSTWGCAANESPPKDDIFRLYLASQISQSGQFLHIGYVRATGTGDTDVNIEFNKLTGDFSCPGNTGRLRSRDDLMLSFTFGGGADSSVIDVFRWDDTLASDGPGDPAPGDPGQGGNDFVAGDGHWDKVALAPNVAKGLDNAAFNGGSKEGDLPKITDQFFDDSVLEPRTFGELTLDLGAIFGAGLLGCPGTGFVNAHSRASHDFASDLKEVFPETLFDLSNCASIKIKKVDNSVPPVNQQGAIYGLYDSATTASNVANNVAPLNTEAAAKAAAVSWCSTGADGTCLLHDADPAKDYWIAEITPPSGLLGSTEVRAVDDSQLEPFTTLDLSGAPFVNNVPVGNVTITKRLFNDANHNNVLDPGEQVTPDQMSDLDGIRFTLQQGGVTSKTHPADTDATCVISGGTGQCTISSVRLGTYQILETLNPSGPSGIGLGTSPSVTITTNGQTVTANYDNPLSPINIALDKLGDKDQANVGDTVNYTFTVTTTGVRLHNVTLAEWVGVLGPVTYADICDSGPTFDAALSTGEEDGFLEVGDAFVWKCPHLVTGSDPDPLPNRARAAGIDDVGRSAEAFDIFNVDILYPDLQVVKQAADGVDAGSTASADETIDAPGTATYTVTVTNVGAGIARNATLTDTLPPGTWTVSLTSPDGNDVCPVGGNPKSGSFTCTFGDLAAGASKVVTVSRAVTIANDCAAVLVNNAGVTTTYLTVDIDPNSANDSSSATIRVRCPDVGVVKTASNSPISAGERAQWTITLTNNGPGVATGVYLVDSIPAGLTDPQVGGANGASCSLVGNAVTCSFGDIAPNDGAPGGPDTRVITVSGLTDAADCATIPNTATVASTSLGAPYVDSNPNNNSSTASVVVQCPDVYVDKSGPAEVSAGDTITWSITFGNHGPGDAFNAILTDVLPAGLTGYQLTDPDEVCDLAGGTVTCTFTVLEDDETYTISVTGTTGTTAQACGNVVNPASISASNEATGTVRDNNFDSVTTDVECPNVDLEKVADDPSTVSAGDPVGFTISVANAAGEDIGIARNVVVTDTLPDIPGYVWEIDDVVSAEEDPCSLVGLELTCDFGDLSPGETASVHVLATQDGETDPEEACGTYPNTGTVALSNGTEADQTDNSDSVTILCPGVNLGKAADAGVVDAGDEIGFTITVSNIDDGEPPAEGVAHDVVVVDDLPGDLAWTVASDSDLPEGASCDIDEGVLTCELGDLPAIDEEDAPQVTIHVVADTTEADCAVYDNTASASVANGVDPDDAQASSRVRCPISIDLDKTGDAVAHVGDVVDYQFTATNTGGEDLIDVELTDPDCDEGTITLVDDGDGDAILAAGSWDPELEAFVDGEVWVYTCERTLTAADVVLVDGADFALNTGSVRGEDADGREVTDTDPHVVEIITPVIQVVKTVDDETPDVGQTVTFTYVVTNTGDTTLFGVEVIDDQLGPIGTIPELAVGASATLTKTMVVSAASPTRNVATATGADVLGKKVTDDDDATITVVLGEVIVRKPEALPRTGVDSDRLLLVSGMFLLLGGLFLISSEGWTLRTSRRRQG